MKYNTDYVNNVSAYDNTEAPIMANTHKLVIQYPEGVSY